MIMKNEEQKLTDFESEYNLIVQEWENNLPVRKSKLEEKLRREMNEQELFYQQGTSIMNQPN
jgi:hypothetical protein